MDFSLILFLLAFIVVVVLIFKFIKKLVFAVLSVIVLVVLVFAGVGFLVYSDFNYLTSQQDFTAKIVYAKGDEYVLGLEVPFVGQEPNVEAVKGISEDLETLNVEDISSDDGVFVIVIQEETYKEIIEGETFDLSQALGEEIQTNEVLSEFSLNFTSQDAIEIIEAQDPTQELVEIILDNSGIPEFLVGAAKPIAVEVIDQATADVGVEVEEAVFAYTLADSISQEENILPALEAFKNKEIEVYPERFVFKIVRLLPVDFINDQIEGATSNEE